MKSSESSFVKANINGTGATCEFREYVNEGNDYAVMTKKSSVTPHPDFQKALDGFKDMFATLIGLTKESKSKLRISQVIVKGEGESESIIVTGILTVTADGKVSAINTPLLSSELIDHEILKQVAHEAYQYTFKSKSTQLSMSLGDEEEKKEEEKEKTE